MKQWCFAFPARKRGAIGILGEVFAPPIVADDAQQARYAAIEWMACEGFEVHGYYLISSAPVPKDVEDSAVLGFNRLCEAVGYWHWTRALQAAGAKELTRGS